MATTSTNRTSTNTWPIIADPWWNPFSWNRSKVWNVLKKGGRVLARDLKTCLGGAARWMIPTGVGVGAADNAAKKIAGRLAVQVAGGPWAYVSIGVAGCVAGYL